MTTITIALNGAPRDVPGPATLDRLLAYLELDPRSVVVEHNRTIVRRAELDRHSYSDGDTIEIVHFVGGG